VESGLGGSTAPLGVAGFEAGGAAQARRHLRTRLRTRGALGNGLRVVAGAVLASEGFLVVTTAIAGSNFTPSATARRRSSPRRRSTSRSAPASRSGPPIWLRSSPSYDADSASNIASFSLSSATTANSSINVFSGPLAVRDEADLLALLPQAAAGQSADHASAAPHCCRRGSGARSP
jgi:hypothetical protein